MTTTVTGAGHAVFATALGWCGLAWTPAGVTLVRLPAPSAGGARAALRERAGAGEAPVPDHVRPAVDGITALLAGQPADLSGVPLDLTLPAFDRRVYDVTRAIPPGATRTYGEVAGALGLPGAARAVGRALGRNPVPLLVPCHRVLAAGGRIGGFSAPGGVVTKRRLLAVEAVHGGGPPTLFDEPPAAPAALPFGPAESAPA